MKKPTPDGPTDSCLFPLLWWFIILPVLQFGPALLVSYWLGFDYGVSGILLLFGSGAAWGISLAWDSWICGEMSAHVRKIWRR